ncbi:hypothetical protein ACJX0J_024361, partial [Zea mays]
MLYIIHFFGHIYGEYWALFFKTDACSISFGRYVVNVLFEYCKNNMDVAYIHVVLTCVVSILSASGRRDEQFTHIKPLERKQQRAEYAVVSGQIKQDFHGRIM